MAKNRLTDEQRVFVTSLRSSISNRLEESKKLVLGFSEYEAAYTEGEEAIMEELLDRLDDVLETGEWYDERTVSVDAYKIEGANESKVQSKNDAER